MPDLDLDPEASEKLRTVLGRPSHPSAADDKLARAKRALAKRRQAGDGEDGEDEALAR
jgi:hypothetical protein